MARNNNILQQLTKLTEGKPTLANFRKAATLISNNPSLNISLKDLSATFVQSATDQQIPVSGLLAGIPSIIQDATNKAKGGKGSFLSAGLNSPTKAEASFSPAVGGNKGAVSNFLAGINNRPEFKGGTSSPISGALPLTSSPSASVDPTPLQSSIPANGAGGYVSPTGEYAPFRLSEAAKSTPVISDAQRYTGVSTPTQAPVAQNTTTLPSFLGNTVNQPSSIPPVANTGVLPIQPAVAQQPIYNPPTQSISPTVNPVLPQARPSPTIPLATSPVGNVNPPPVFPVGGSVGASSDFVVPDFSNSTGTPQYTVDSGANYSPTGATGVLAKANNLGGAETESGTNKYLTRDFLLGSKGNLGALTGGAQILSSIGGFINGFQNTSLANKQQEATLALARQQYTNNAKAFNSNIDNKIRSQYSRKNASIDAINEANARRAKGKGRTVAQQEKIKDKYVKDRAKRFLASEKANF